MRRLFGIAIALLTVATVSLAQTHVAGVVGGAVVAWQAPQASWLISPAAGFSSTIELGDALAVGIEAQFTQRGNPSLNLDYVETPVFLSVSDPRSRRGSRAFVRAGFAPSVEIHCRVDSETEAGYAGRRQGPAQHVAASMPRLVPGTVGTPWIEDPALSRHKACLSQRTHRLDFGWLAGVGVSFREGRQPYAVELRRTIGLRNLNDASMLFTDRRNRAVALLVSRGTRRP